jgi:hypothetical protein
LEGLSEEIGYQTDGIIGGILRRRLGTDLS